MDCSALIPTELEEHITDDMLDLYMEEAFTSAAPPDLCVAGPKSAATAKQRKLSNTVTSPFSFHCAGTLAAFPATTPRAVENTNGGSQGSGTLIKMGSSEKIVLQRQSRRSSVWQISLVDERASLSVITSDDSGDFAFLTRDVRDANAYDAIRNYMVYCKQQEKDLQKLEEECARLEAEQQLLYGTAVAVNMTKRGSLAQSVASILLVDGTVPRDCNHGISKGSRPTEESVASEFAESDIDPLKPCPSVDGSGGGASQPLYRYGQPEVLGTYTPIFKGGFLYRCIIPEGMWVFYNDSQRYRMEVKYIFGASSILAAGPHASLQRLPSGEVEIAVTVWPQQTEVLLEGEVNGFKNLSVATLVDASYVNPHTAASTAAARALLNRYAHQSGKSSVTMLTTEDVLDCCFKGSKGIATSGGDAASSLTTAYRYVDPAFPPCSVSIYRHGVDEVFLWDMPWRCPADYLPKKQASEACLFAGAALPTDPFTGDGGDVYFCSAAAILAEHPECVHRLFRHPISAEAGRKERAVGAYHVTIGHGGWWTSTVVDEYLPASLLGPDMGRCPYDLRKLWYPLLEKAYAKLHGSYAAIQCGDPLEALQDFTGFPTFRFDEEWAAVAETVRGSLSSFTNTPETERLFAMIEESVNECGYMVCLNLPDEGPAEAKQVQLGMMYGSSYAVLRVVRYADYRLVQVRCPTMRLDGDGLWCAESVRWRQEPALASLCGMSVAASGCRGGAAGERGCADSKIVLGFNSALAPGCLWLDWSEVLLIFEGGGVCCTHWDWTEDCRVRGTFQDGVPSFVLEVRVEVAGEGDEGEASPVEAYCMLSQEDDRGLLPDNPNRALQPLMLCISGAAGVQEASELSGSTSTRQCIRCGCSIHPDRPATQLTYILGRDTALRTTFLPSAHPYYVIPRCLGEMSNKVFTVGIVSSTPVTKRGKLRVRVVQLPSTSPVFENEREFSTERVTDAPPASFQIRSADGRVRVGCGHRIG
ncbi:putative calpain-like cysteine peptidase putative cysteine peptidase Clan CA family C2 [Leptomonas seymouri]|uniref:Putative calpain-like cysteine peptidase putative cysteine peptidase Clan CA family C2 n=1 Tax=Leptomonas seymouri TaxID=5684 RepID=A0A0N1I8N2_LEPSE|nr:putative calpain-like cysteine peptidase putative cysteine peptidase Clan CA family C2 [Leptomonas seymouri]|eukprot:KPI90321.1 putative calpain-like cysteine peptidase putative cysteine peptidase Clan CA family C2 [Leptomonas seymouri]